jgi:hypothetical protein
VSGVKKANTAEAEEITDPDTVYFFHPETTPDFRGVSALPVSKSRVVSALLVNKSLGAHDVVLSGFPPSACAWLLLLGVHPDIQ